jgi:hypothetical protein
MELLGLECNGTFSLYQCLLNIGHLLQKVKRGKMPICKELVSMNWEMVKFQTSMAAIAN